MALTTNQLQLLNQKLTDLISNKITVSGNSLTINGKVLNFSSSKESQEISKRNTLSR